MLPAVPGVPCNGAMVSDVELGPVTTVIKKIFFIRGNDLVRLKKAHPHL